MPEASRLDRRRETNSFYQSNMSQYVERYFHLLYVSGDMTLPYNLVYVYNRIDKTRWLSYYHFCSTCMGTSLKPFSIGVAKTHNGNSEGKNVAVYFRELMARTDNYGALPKKKQTLFLKLLSKEMHLVRCRNHQRKLLHPAMCRHTQPAKHNP